MWKTNLITFLTASLQRKLMLAFMVLVTVVMSAGGIYLLRNQQQSASAALEAHAVHMTQMLSKTLAVPLWNIDLKSIHDQLEMVMADPEIYSVALYQREQNQPLASKKRDGQAVAGIACNAPVIYERDQPPSATELGSVRLVYTRYYMYQAVERTRMGIVAAMLLLLASLSLATYVLLRRMVQKPIGELLAMTQRVADGDLDVRIPVLSRDDIGLLSEKLNHMTDRLKQTMDGLGKSERKYKRINETLEVRIQERTDELRLLLHSVGEGIFGVDAAGRVTFINPAALNMLGFSESEMTGKGVHDLIHHSRKDGSRYPDEDCPMYASFTRAVTNHVTDEVLWCKDGGSFPVEYSSMPIIKDGKVLGAVVTFYDITERKQVNDKLEKSAAALRNQVGELSKARKSMLNILEDLKETRKEAESAAHKINAMSQAVVDALMMINGQGLVQFWNQGAEKLFGYTAEEAMGMNFHEMVVPPELREKAQAGMGNFAATGQGVVFGATIQTTAVNRSGLIFPVEVSISPFQVDDAWFAVGTVRDITERNQAENELKAHIEDLERFSRLTINREEKMIQLKEEINTLLEQTGKEKKYKIVA
ncbi:MAG: PAS domain S-box protein [Deltaproteobacteria bacterium]|nr:PAS domain S-box protein [Deltaproteobacteria bacterium]